MASMPYFEGNIAWYMDATSQGQLISNDSENFVHFLDVFVGLFVTKSTLRERCYSLPQNVRKVSMDCEHHKI